MKRAILMWAGLAVAVIVSGAAQAADKAAHPAGSLAATSGVARSAPAPMGNVAAQQDPVVTDAELANYRGGQNVVTGNQTLNSNTTGNTINGNYTAGSINILNSAFSNFNGIGNFAINTGAQVSLQSAMNLTINVSP